MSLNCEDQELLEGFLTETTELLEKVDYDLLMLEKTPGDVAVIAGATILGDGKVALIVDPAKLIDGGEEEMFRHASSF